MSSLRVVFLHPLNEYFKILYLLFPYFDFLLQFFDLGFQFGLLVFIGGAHHSVSFVTQLAVGVVLIDFEEKSVKLIQPETNAFCVPVSLLRSVMEASVPSHGVSILRSGLRWK